MDPVNMTLNGSSASPDVTVLDGTVLDDSGEKDIANMINIIVRPILTIFGTFGKYTIIRSMYQRYVVFTSSDSECGSNITWNGTKGKGTRELRVIYYRYTDH